MDEPLPVDRIYDALCALPPTGQAGFEGLISFCLERHFGRPFRLARAGVQYGADAATEIDQAAPIFIETKLYDRRSLDGRNILGEIAQLCLRRQARFSTWILVTTASIGYQLAEDLHRDTEARDLHLILIDWHVGNQVPLLLALLIHFGAHVRSWMLLHGLLDVEPFDILGDLHTMSLPIDDPTTARLLHKLSGLGWNAPFVKARLEQAIALQDGAAKSLCRNCLDAARLVVDLNMVAEAGSHLEALQDAISANATLAMSGFLRSDERLARSSAMLEQGLAAFLSGGHEGALDRPVAPAAALAAAGPRLRKIRDDLGKRLEGEARDTVRLDLDHPEFSEIAGDVRAARILLHRAAVLIDSDLMDRGFLALSDAIGDLLQHLNMRSIDVILFAHAVNALDEACARAPATIGMVLQAVLGDCRFLLGRFAPSGRLPPSTTFRIWRDSHDFVIVKGCPADSRVELHFALSRTLLSIPEDTGEQASRHLLWVKEPGDLDQVIAACDDMTGVHRFDIGLPTSQHLDVFYRNHRYALDRPDPKLLATDEIMDGMARAVRLYCVP